MGSEIVVPVSDSSPLQWTTIPSIPIIHWMAVDEGTVLGGSTPSDDDALETQTPGNAEQLALGNLSAAATGGVITRIDVNWRGWVDDDDGETDSYIELRLYHSGGTPVTGNPKTINSTDLGGQRVIAEVTKSWTGLTLTKTQADSLEIKMTLVDPS